MRKAALREVVAAILVDIGEDDGRIGLEGIKHPVAVMRVDIDVGDAFQAIFLLQDLDGHAGVVEHAKTGSGIGHAVVQAGDGHEGTPDLVGHDSVSGVDHRADHYRGILEYPFVGRSVAVIQQALSHLGIGFDLFDVLGCMEQSDLLLGGGGGMQHAHLVVEVANMHLVPEGMDAVLSERVVFEPVAAQFFTGVHSHRSASRHYSRSSLGAVGFAARYHSRT